VRVMAGLKMKLSKYLRQRISKFGLTESGVRSAHKSISLTIKLHVIVILKHLYFKKLPAPWAFNYNFFLNKNMSQNILLEIELLSITAVHLMRYHVSGQLDEFGASSEQT